MTGPDDQIQYSVFRQSTANVEISADKEGLYTYCFSNQMSTVSHKVLTFSMHGPDEKFKFEEKYKGFTESGASQNPIQNN